MAADFARSITGASVEAIDVSMMMSLERNSLWRFPGFSSGGAPPLPFGRASICQSDYRKAGKCWGTAPVRLSLLRFGFLPFRFRRAGFSGRLAAGLRARRRGAKFYKAFGHIFGDELFRQRIGAGFGEGKGGIH